MHWLFVISILVTICEITSYIEGPVLKYFNNDIVVQFNNLWKNHRVAYQETLELAMQEGLGYKDMNVYMKRPIHPYKLAKGYYHTDNQVHLVFEDLNLDSFPNIFDPKISLLLPNNVIKLEASVSRMIVHANYMLFRNTSNIIYSKQDQNPFQASPFLFEQVQNMGQVALSIDGCKLSGIGLTTLIGRSVNLGHNIFRLLNCQYSIEIFTPGVVSPPVITSYLPNGQGLDLDHLLITHITGELVPKLQAALFSHINTSALLEEKLTEIRLEQQRIFESSSNYVNNLIRNFNMLTMNKNLGKIMMNDFRITWNDTFDNGIIESVISLHDMVLTGLETVYSTHTGGPLKLDTEQISEEIRFGTLQVRGSIDLISGDSSSGMQDFAVEIEDVEVDVTADLYTSSQNEPSKSIRLLEVMGFRSMHFSSPGMTFIAGESLITGYLLSQVPQLLTAYMKKMVKQAAQVTEEEYTRPLETENKGIDRNTMLESNLEPADNGEDDNGNVEQNQDNDGNVQMKGKNPNNGDDNFGNVYDTNNFNDESDVGSVDNGDFGVRTKFPNPSNNGLRIGPDGRPKKMFGENMFLNIGTNGQGGPVSNNQAKQPYQTVNNKQSPSNNAGRSDKFFVENMFHNQSQNFQYPMLRNKKLQMKKPKQHISRRNQRTLTPLRKATRTPNQSRIKF